MEENVFKYPDTNSANGKIEWLNRKFNGQKVAIIGLGGTGSYILDMIAKTPVPEIHLFDGDDLELKNTFRSPGAIDIQELENAEDGLKKVHYYQKQYSKMRSGIFAHPEYIIEDNIHCLSDFSFVFNSIDKNKNRSKITKKLLTMSVPFIDTGLGVTKLDDTLLGTVRVTAATEFKNDHLTNIIGEMEMDDNLYATNVQIAELNALNAVLAVIKWKKMLGFYQDLKHEHQMLYFINTNKLMNNDYPA